MRNGTPAFPPSSSGSETAARWSSGNLFSTLRKSSDNLFSTLRIREGVNRQRALTGFPNSFLLTKNSADRPAERPSTTRSSFQPSLFPKVESETSFSLHPTTSAPFLGSRKQQEAFDKLKTNAEEHDSIHDSFREGNRCLPIPGLKRGVSREKRHPGLTSGMELANASERAVSTFVFANASKGATLMKRDDLKEEIEEPDILNSHHSFNHILALTTFTHRKPHIEVGGTAFIFLINAINAG